jgi:hypothetical protein
MDSFRIADNHELRLHSLVRRVFSDERWATDYQMSKIIVGTAVQYREHFLMGLMR